MFLREHSLASLTFSSFVQKLSQVEADGFVQVLGLQIQGKTDKTPVTLLMWSDIQLRELCPVQQLLVYLAVIGHTEGPLFPSLELLKERTQKKVGRYERPIGYSTFLTKVKEVCKRVCKRDGPWGTHTMRKTAYLLAV